MQNQKRNVNTNDITIDGVRYRHIMKFDKKYRTVHQYLLHHPEVDYEFLQGRYIPEKHWHLFKKKKKIDRREYQRRWYQRNKDRIDNK